MREWVPTKRGRSRGKIAKDKYPALNDEDQEAIRQQAVAAINFVQAGKQAAAAIAAGDEEAKIRP